jgi:hypothetical protein
MHNFQGLQAAGTHWFVAGFTSWSNVCVYSNTQFKRKRCPATQTAQVPEETGEFAMSGNAASQLTAQY